MNSKSLVLASLVLTAAIAGCKPNPPAEPAAEAPKADAAIAAAPEPAPAPVAPALDAKAFAGTFSGTLPCADCPGIDTRVELKADGTYAIEETYQERKDGNSKSDGTWTAEEAGQRVRLDPNSKSEDDRLYQVVSADEIRALDKEGKAIDSQANLSLKRQPAAQ
ncbi:copper resistance protein NlpE [Lysobacter silvisoli]|uniref:Copper resistance protein NlpE n=1 Tax=Lysobacter silvisoli TaxID=2293254 RepID=A0A371K4H4_9GAMM|nr:copper resistance protein NlpE [Lysobacter silvisoli]RDZ28831.1 copper resistance protein NlpE [Lysobacter silvisoli]